MEKLRELEHAIEEIRAAVFVGDSLRYHALGRTYTAE
jgi:hypothetical protein